jgi:hypothetical protein
MLVAVVALFIALGGIASAKAIGLIDGHNIKPGTVGHAQLAKRSVFSNNIAKGAVHSDNIAPSLLAHIMGNKSPSVGAAGGQGSKGDKGDRGDTGAPGHDGANPGAVVTQVPSIASSSGHNPNPDSGDPGQQGFYFTGTGTGGSASIAGGELILTGVGIDGNTEQGGIGIAKAFNVPLSSLDGVSWSYHILTPNGNNTPLVHVTVTGLNADSKFASGFANLVYAPALNGVTAAPGQDYVADAFLPGAKWYSTTESIISNPGGQNAPQPLSFFTGRNSGATIVQISLDNGGSSGASGSFVAGADDLVIGLNGSITRYDFGG